MASNPPSVTDTEQTSPLHAPPSDITNSSVYGNNYVPGQVRSDAARPNQPQGLPTCLSVGRPNAELYAIDYFNNASPRLDVLKHLMKDDLLQEKLVIVEHRLWNLINNPTISPLERSHRRGDAFEPLLDYVLTKAVVQEIFQIRQMDNNPAFTGEFPVEIHGHAGQPGSSVMQQQATSALQPQAPAARGLAAPAPQQRAVHPPSDRSTTNPTAPYNDRATVDLTSGQHHLATSSVSIMIANSPRSDMNIPNICDMPAYLRRNENFQSSLPPTDDRNPTAHAHNQTFQPPLHHRTRSPPEAQTGRKKSKTAASATSASSSRSNALAPRPQTTPSASSSNSSNVRDEKKERFPTKDKKAKYKKNREEVCEDCRRRHAACDPSHEGRCPPSEEQRQATKAKARRALS